MPNWAYGHTDITGTKAAILSFVNRYIFPDEPTTIDGVKYFARSFLHVDREEIKAEIGDAAGFAILGGMYRGARITTATKEMVHPADFAGFKLRAPGIDMYVKTWEWLGARP